MNCMTPEEMDPMTLPEPTRTVPGWTYDEMSQLFWHHYYRFFAASGLATATGLLGAAVFSAGWHRVSILFMSQCLLMTAFSIWHRARTSLLTKMIFPGRRVG
jgi:hypothetical protein